MKRVVPAFFVVLLAAANALAQTSAAGSIRGYARDTTGAVLPGVTVTATSASVPGSRVVTTDAEGIYRLLDLPPADYSVTFELEGFTKLVRDGLAVRAGGNVPLDASLAVGALTDVVEVKADTPMLEARDVRQAVNVSGDFQRSVPLSGRRDWADSMAVTPGVVTVQFPGVAGMYYLHGADFSSHVLQVDGADLASAAQGYNGFINLSTEALGDAQSRRAPSTPRRRSASVPWSALPRRAAPTPSRAAAIVYQDKAWNSSNVEGGTASEIDSIQPDLSLGGPLVRDKWWFFGAYRYTRSDTGVSRTAGQVATLKAL